MTWQRCEACGHALTTNATGALMPLVRSSFVLDPAAECSAAELDEFAKAHGITRKVLGLCLQRLGAVPARTATRRWWVGVRRS